MSYFPAIVPQISLAAHEADETFATSPGTHVMSLFSPPSSDRVPLSLRTSHELWARSAELARMAETARTTDAKVALETLAARFAALAAKREAAEEREHKNQEANKDCPLPLWPASAADGAPPHRRVGVGRSRHTRLQ